MPVCNLQSNAYLGAPDMVEAAKMLEKLGCDYVIHHIGYDERRGLLLWENPCLVPWISLGKW